MTFLDPDLAFFLTFAGLYMLLALGLNLQWGYGGLFNLGVAGFWAMGAYGFVWLSSRHADPSLAYPGHWGHGLPIPVGILGAIALTTVFAVAVAYPALRLRADYLAIVTIGFSEIFRRFLVNEQSITGGVHGVGPIGPIPRPFPDLRAAEAEVYMMLVVVGLFLVLLVLAQYLSRSPWGRSLRAVRDDEAAAQALGKDAFRLKLSAFAMGASFMGLAGALYALFTRFIEPVSKFTPVDTFFVATAVILGGLGNHRGAALGAFALWGVTYGLLRFKDQLPDFLQPKIDFVRLALIGVFLIVVVLWRPSGILPEERVVSRT
ncbi:MAG TPA: branched-chain amino acid ABC transporter permease [Candidatus Thermoplasmatota archaeon]|nr:branched-chain amino acid ABC transporter permease [Candidatus Thermoplasmatota archaeon]